MKHLKNKRIGVLMGGASSEREISLRSGSAVLNALQSQGLNVFALELSNNSKEWAEQIQAAKVEVAFIALHGTYGEDGCIQGLLEILQIPYSGSGVMASAMCINKALTKAILAQYHLPTPQDVPLMDGVPADFPVFVKPIAEGSSVGLHRVENAAQWHALGLKNIQSLLIEQVVAGKEIAVSVLHGRALPPVEIAPKSGLYDFASKYTAGATEYFCPARLPETQLTLCRDMAAHAVKVLGCKGAPRVDLIAKDDGSVVILEVNTIPGMTATSLLPKSASKAGLGFTELCLEILQGVTFNVDPYHVEDTTS